ncbi:DUF6083 domain-containing protein [Streptomyces sp. NPDC050997]|uniref:DUF6083 domain-containing protein n=1 Tax=Streptomyces sp. NPDC050997 TaxID=3155519 RepID=UPI003433CC56
MGDLGDAAVGLDKAYDENGVAWNAGDAEPAPGMACRIAHRLACPGLEPMDLWRWLTAMREENARKAQRLFNPQTASRRCL